MKLVPSHIDRHHRRGATTQHAVSEPTSRGACIDNAQTTAVQREPVQCSDEFVTAPGHEPGCVARDFDGLARINQSRRFVSESAAHGDAPFCNDLLSPGPALNQTPSHQFRIEPTPDHHHSIE